MATAFIAKGYSNIMNYIQTLFSIFNAPLFATFIIAMFWKRATPWAGFCSLVAGTAAAYAINRLAAYHTIFHFGSRPWMAASGRRSSRSSSTPTVLVGVSLVTTPKPESRARGLVWGMARGDDEADFDPRDGCGGARRGCSRRRDHAIVIVLNILFI